MPFSNFEAILSFHRQLLDLLDQLWLNITVVSPCNRAILHQHKSRHILRLSWWNCETLNNRSSGYYLYDVLLYSFIVHYMILYNTILCYSSMLHCNIMILYCMTLYFIINRMDIICWVKNVYMHCDFMDSEIDYKQQANWDDDGHLADWMEGRNDVSMKKNIRKSRKYPSTCLIDVVVYYLPQLFWGSAL